jgi:GTP-binding protein EngB required for normal cell division
VIFGFATVLDESFETISKVLKKFFEFQGSIQTHTIVTDRREGIEMAISQLN